MTHLYFAYGSNMDEKQMARRCPGAEVVGNAILPGYRFIIYHRGYATLLPEEEAHTPGVLWRIDAHHEAALDGYEGYPEGLYDKCVRRVTTGDNTETEVLVYIDHDNRKLGAPRDGYLERILAAARARQFPESHVLLLRAWPRANTFRAWNQLLNWMKSGASCGIALPFPAGIRDDWHQRFPDNVRQEAVQWLRQHRDEIILCALSAYCAADDEDFEGERLAHGADAQEGFTAFLLREALCEAENQMREYNTRLRGKLAERYVGLTRFLRRVEALQASDAPLEVVGPFSRQGRELGGRGAIITRDPERPCPSGDRFVVTEHAETVAALWEYLFSIRGEVYAHPRDCRFLEIFADSAAQFPDGPAEDLVRHILQCIGDAARERMGELEQHLDRLS